jgi:MoaA/NifB/PqqE/SkfB family radical SAM enzyme
MGVEEKLRWLEISADYRCNNRCIGCHSVQDQGPRMSTREAAEHLLRARQRGATSLWLGGGEPTLRKDSFALVKKARELGYARIKLQTNGMLLSYAEVTRAYVEAGVTEVSFSIKGATAESHDRLTRTPGCHALMLAGIEQVRGHGLTMTGDTLLYASNVHELPAMVRTYAALGLSHFDVWCFSAVDQGDRDLASQVPKLSDVARGVVQAMDENPGVSLTSLHTPPCVIPETHARCLFHAADLGLLVTNPGGTSFMLEQSAIEGGVFLPSCARCAERPRCGGARRDYLAIHGDAELRPR